MIELTIIPTLNAVLNATTACLLMAGYYCVRTRRLTAHGICMGAATFTSALFLAGYLYYHAHHGVTPFTGKGGIRQLYFLILGTHTILAAVQLPMIFFTLRYALSAQRDKHGWIARRTLPIWLYVSWTGVAVYWMLYRMNFQ